MRPIIFGWIPGNCGNALVCEAARLQYFLNSCGGSAQVEKPQACWVTGDGEKSGGRKARLREWFGEGERERFDVRGRKLFGVRERNMGVKCSQDLAAST